MEYKVVNINTGRRALLGNYPTKSEAEQAIVNAIRGVTDKKEALKYYKTMGVKPV